MDSLTSVTREDVERMEAGTELDAAVVALVCRQPPPGSGDPPPFSTDSDYAWQMEERVQSISVPAMQAMVSELVRATSVPTNSEVGAVGFDLWACIHASPEVRARSAVLAMIELDAASARRNDG